MGGGAGGIVVITGGSFSGQGGGRIIPGTPSNLCAWGYRSDQTAPFSIPALTFDNRSNPIGNFRYGLEGYGSPSSSAGQIGRNSDFIVYSYLGVDGVTYTFNSFAGAGGGWGAQGGTMLIKYGAETRIGGAAGKAIDTGGNAVTWIGGSSRVYGVVG